MSGLRKHPDEIQLALFAGKDSGWFANWRTGRHVARCTHCAAEVAALQSERQELRELAAEMPATVNWSRLTEEMTGNIRVGLAAGECIAGFEKSPRIGRAGRPGGLGWNAALVLACATAVVIVALWIQLPRPELEHLARSLRRIRFDRIGMVSGGAETAQQGVVLEASPLSIGIRENGGAMSLLHPRSSGAAVTVSMQGSAGVRYVDADNGQVTTNRVYYGQ